MNKNKGTSLVDYLAEAVGCEFISDLPREAAIGNPKVEMQLQKLDLRAFSLHEWNDALEYLSGKSAQETPEAAYMLLIKELQKARCNR